MNILIFGKDGQLGKAIKVLFDQLPSVANKHVTYLGRSECDLSSESAVLETLSLFKPNLIINASAYTAVDKAETEIDLAYAVNAKAPELMARYAAENNATFLHYSTDYVFDGQKMGFYDENDPRNPLGVYGKSKAAGEEAIGKVFEKSLTGQFAIFRTSWVYGDGGNFIRTIFRLANEREELKIISDQFGVPTNAEWLAQVSLHLALDPQFHLRKFTSGIYHAVPSGETSWHGLASLVVQTALDAGVMLKTTPRAVKPIPASEYPLPAPRPMNSRMSTDVLRQSFIALGDMSKLQQLGQPWDQAVVAYVQKLAKDSLI